MTRKQEQAKPVGKIRVRNFALDQLKTYFASGRIQVGQRLPSERELAAQLDVSRNSLREALKVLEAMGVIASRVGDGTYLLEKWSIHSGHMPSLSLSTLGSTLLEILDARLMFEVEVAAIAAERATPNDLLLLQRELETMNNSGMDLSAYLKADMNFHRLTAQSSQNPLVSRIVSELIDMLETVLATIQDSQLPLTAEGTDTHQKVFEAIARKDTSGAADAMRRHLQFSAELWRVIISLSNRSATL